MRDHLDRLGPVLPVVVTFADDPSRLAAYREHLAIDFPLVADPDRSLYRAIGAGRGTRRAVWSVGTLRLYARLLGHGRRLRVPREDIRQLGADLLIDATGTVRRVWLPPSPDRRPSVEELAVAVRELGS